MKRKVILLAFSFLIVLIPTPAFADGRVKTIQETYTEYIWVINDQGGQEHCRLITENTRPPQIGLISALCGQAVLEKVNDGGMVIHYLTSRSVERDVEIKLPEIKITLDQTRKENQFYLIVRASDPLPGEDIVQIEARLDDTPVVCEESPCIIPLYNKTNAEIEYWAVSSFGDVSDHHRALLRIEDQGVRIIGDRSYIGWQPSDRVPKIWSAIPPENLPEWLKTAGKTQLYTDIPYTYLAGQAIISGAVGVSDCENNGIIPYSGGYASQCGLEHAREKVTGLQNAYNEEIAAAARFTGVPPRILKGIIAQESQFWPDAHGIAGENGLYQLSRDGADTLLRWNGESFLMYCKRYLKHCDQLGYDSRQEWERELLISAVMGEAHKVDLLGEILTGKAAQVDRLLDNYFGIDPAGEVLDYGTLWRLTIANYNAGPNLVAAVLWEVDRRGLEFTWENIGDVLKQMQPSVYEYVRRITNVWVVNCLGLSGSCQTR